MPVICPKCKNNTSLVYGIFYYLSDEEPCESEEHVELYLEGEKRISGHYCEQCDVMIEVWDDDACSKEFQNEVDAEESKLRDHFAGLAMQGMMTYISVWDQGTCQADYIANHAYTIADAMLKARKEVKP